MSRVVKIILGVIIFIIGINLIFFGIACIFAAAFYTFASTQIDNEKELLLIASVATAAGMAFIPIGIAVFKFGIVLLKV